MKWIKTSERLPEPRQLTLICTDGMHGTEEVLYVSVFERRKVWGNDTLPYGWRGPGPYSFFGARVTHWAPIEGPQ